VRGERRDVLAPRRQQLGRLTHGLQTRSRARRGQRGGVASAGRALFWAGGAGRWGGVRYRLVLTEASSPSARRLRGRRGGPRATASVPATAGAPQHRTLRPRGKVLLSTSPPRRSARRSAVVQVFQRSTRRCGGTGTVGCARRVTIVRGHGDPDRLQRRPVARKRCRRVCLTQRPRLGQRLP
jgi:hypothetical protein